MSSCADLFLDNPSGPSLHVRVWGRAAPTVLLLHGSGDGAFVWEDFVSHFPNPNGIAAMDLRGHGDSGWDPNSDYSVDAHVLDVACAMQQLRMRNVIVIGHSLGGEVGIRVAAMYPDTIAGVVVVDFGPEISRDSVNYAREAYSERFRHYATLEDYFEFTERQLPIANNRLLKRINRQAVREALFGGYELKCDPSLVLDSKLTDEKIVWSDLKQARCPMLLMRGEYSSFLPQAMADRMSRELHYCEIETIKGAGHAVMLDNPAEFFSVASSFLSELLDSKVTPVITKSAVSV